MGGREEVFGGKSRCWPARKKGQEAGRGRIKMVASREEGRRGRPGKSQNGCQPERKGRRQKVGKAVAVGRVVGKVVGKVVGVGGETVRWRWGRWWVAVGNVVGGGGERGGGGGGGGGGKVVGGVGEDGGWRWGGWWVLVGKAEGAGGEGGGCWWGRWRAVVVAVVVNGAGGGGGDGGEWWG